ncbi:MULTISPECIES: hypothetical protein [unclassified Bosea (in: a-proteobacteria)]|uniref:hypothetical protein n=1 Tax=unclassified Bosea (in: a-proteobacteria) TaxID=2653178 RepID=UPI000F764E3A|nr:MULTISPECIES: hypothetical protein [unclassified Bosea (in: a-proteobacteria)]AZO78664.1 hypothetical protein BLM15_14310 [Bosea sp. Tri-49]RXT17548.1 hypothetical protein B5U98_26120 [Bosea sp. Tri-39]RXT40920.1 hypothetical protein B5U99_03990 [Bosea sp. Tri-54]
MVKLFVVLGLALLAGGTYAIVDGWAYVVLERGFTEVILGALAVAAGLILLALAAVLAEVRRLKGLVSGAMAAVVLSEPRFNERLAPNEALARPEPVLEKENAPEARHVGTATTLAAGAGAAAVAGALTSLAKAEEPAGEKASDKTDDDDGGHSKRSDHAEVVVAEPQQPPSTVTGEIDDWLLPPLPAALDAAPSEVSSDERSVIEKEPPASEGEQDLPISAGIGEPSRPNQDDDEESVEADPVQVPVKEPEADQVKTEADAIKPESAPAPGEDRLWWPSIDRPSTEATASVADEFTALRDQLSGVINAPEVELPRRDRVGVSDGLGTAETWMAPRAWPPVTHPRDPGALGDVEIDTADKASAEDAEAETVATSKPVTQEPPEPEPEEELTQVPGPAEAEVPPAETAEIAAEAKSDKETSDKEPSDDEPAASEEGVIGAYQVGETQFTMFADGSIHARTPDGDYTFASMDELKTYLASEKDKLEPSSN